MTNCTPTTIEFPVLNRKKIQGEFTGGDITSDGGVLLLRQVDRSTGLLESVNRLIDDPRDPRFTKHSQLSLLRQRVYGIALGYEDLNDHEQLRVDPALQTAVDRSDTLAGQSTLCRLENRMDRNVAVNLHNVFVEQFFGSFKRRPKRLILDFDATDDRVHGDQIGKFYHGYYRHHCFLPLYVFCKDQLLVSYLRKSNIDAAKHSWAILALLVKRLRQAWPAVKLVLRGDSGFCRKRMFSWCERHDVDYVVGIAKNPRLLKKAHPLMEQAKQAHAQSKHKQRLFAEAHYAADTWTRSRRVIIKAEHTDKGANPRFVVTSLNHNPQSIYDDIYCARGEMENRIKEQQLGLFADRTSCHAWWANQFRVLLSSCAYILVESIRRVALKGTILARAQINTIRLKLFKVGAIILANTRRIRFLYASSYPYQGLFRETVARLNPG